MPFHLLRAVSELSVGDPDSGNLLIEGDNLLALKALLPYDAGQVKCIYIDPPYNTGEESWVYNDNVNSPEIKEWLGATAGLVGIDIILYAIIIMLVSAFEPKGIWGIVEKIRRRKHK